MNKELLEKMLKMMASDNDTDAVHGLRGAQGLFKAEGSSLEDALRYALLHVHKIRATESTVVDTMAVTVAAARPPVAISGMPQCRSVAGGSIEIILPGQTQGNVVQLPGLAAPEAEAIASNLKDALVAAVINKSRFKLKLLDIKNAHGEVVETALQAEYERDGMIPIRVWVNVKGEVATLASVLRRTVANTMPDLLAS